MPVELMLPGRRVPAPKPPSYLALDMAFGVGAGAVLGDKSRYRSHGAITTATWAAGAHGYCLDFNPAGPDHVLIPAAHTQLNFTTEDFSIIARVRVDDLTANRTIFTRGQSNANGYILMLNAGAGIEVRTYQLAASQTSRSANGTVALATWYTVGLSRTGASIRVYRNGIDITVVAGVHIDPVTCPLQASIGYFWASGMWAFDGRIEFLRIFREIALQPSEHLAWHNALA